MNIEVGKNYMIRGDYSTLDSIKSKLKSHGFKVIDDYKNVINREYIRFDKATAIIIHDFGKLNLIELQGVMKLVESRNAKLTIIGVGEGAWFDNLDLENFGKIELIG